MHGLTTCWLPCKCKRVASNKRSELQTSHFHSTRRITAHLGLAEVYTRQSRERDAISELNEVIGVNPKNIAARVALAKILEAHGDIDGALKSYQELKNSHPEDTEAYLEISRLCEKPGEFSQALNELQSALKAVPKRRPLVFA